MIKILEILPHPSVNGNPMCSIQKISPGIKMYKKFRAPRGYPVSWVKMAASGSKNFWGWVQV